MNKKTIMSLALVGVIGLGIGVGAGTMASYKKDFTSSQNAVRAAKFNVDVNNGKFTDNAMTLVGKDLKPGTNKVAYNFEINKDTEVDVEYQVALTQEGALLDAKTPVKIILQKFVKDKWEDVALDYKYKPESNNEKFQIVVNWADETPGVNDTDYAGKEGKIKITVNANQIIEKVVPPVVKTDSWKKDSAQCSFQWDNRLLSYAKFPNIEYYKLNGTKTLSMGDIYIEGENAFTHKKSIFDMKNLVFTNIAGTNQYKASCTGSWDGKIFNCKKTDSGMGIYYLDFKIDGDYDNSLRIQKDFPDWFAQ